MLETSQSAIRMIALVIFTALFAGLWANDHPDESVAIHFTPIDQPIVESTMAREGIATHQQQKRVQNETVQASNSSTMIATQKSFVLELDDLQLSKAVIAKHVNQLPFGMETGDYRIVDSLGGVGWLRIRSSQSREPTGKPMLETTVGATQVRFIRVQTASIDRNQNLQ